MENAETIRKEAINGATYKELKSKYGASSSRVSELKSMSDEQFNDYLLKKSIKRAKPKPEPPMSPEAKELRGELEVKKLKQQIAELSNDRISGIFDKAQENMIMERFLGGNKNNNSNNANDQRILDLEKQLVESREQAKYDKILNEIRIMKQEQNGNGQQNYKALDLIGLIKLSQNTSDANNNKYNELFMKMIENKNGGNGLGDAIENYKSIESLGVMIGKKHDGGKDKTEIISDLISGIAGQLKDPITKMVDHVVTNAPQPNQEQMQAMQAKVDRVRGKTPSPYNSVPPTNAPVYSNASEQPVSLKANANVEPPTTALPPLDSDGGFSSPPSTEQFLHGQAVFPDMISMYQDQDENGRGKTPVQDNDNYQARNAPEISLQEAEKRMQEKQQNYDNALRESREQLPAHEQQLNDAYAQEQVNGVDPSLITISDKEKKV